MFYMITTQTEQQPLRPRRGQTQEDAGYTTVEFRTVTGVIESITEGTNKLGMRTYFVTIDGDKIEAGLGGGLDWHDGDWAIAADRNDYGDVTSFVPAIGATATARLASGDKLFAMTWNLA